MGAVNAMWLRLLEEIQVAGACGYEGQWTLLSDTGLRAQARVAADRIGAAELLNGIDGEQLEELREAYNEGRRPTRIDMQAVVEHVRKAGVYAYVEQTGGGTATIYAGTLSEWPDGHGDRRHAVAAGPGLFEGRGTNGFTKPYADTSEFWIGPDDDGNEPVGSPQIVSPPEHTHPAAVAALIVSAVRDVEARRERITAAVEAAESAFWGAIVDAFPEVESGDFPIEAELLFARAQHQAVQLWLSLNAPPERIAATLSAALHIVSKRDKAAIERIEQHITASRISDGDLSDLVYDVAFEDVDRLLADGDFYPIGEQTAQEELRARASDLASDANNSGVESQAEVLYDVLGEDKACERITAAAGGAWRWNEHNNESEAWCAHSGEPTGPAPENDDDDLCPAGCPDSQATQDIND